jgi:hypothetical protein
MPTANTQSRALPRYLSLTHLQRVKKWHLAHQAAHPVEYQLWDGVLTLWVIGWTGWLPAFAFGGAWAYPLCVLGMMMPRLYFWWRARAHERGQLRCDWLDQLA